MKKISGEYKIGDRNVDRLITDLTCESCSTETEDILREVITTAVKLGRESDDKGDLKLVNNTLKEDRKSVV